MRRSSWTLEETWTVSAVKNKMCLGFFLCSGTLDEAQVMITAKGVHVSRQNQADNNKPNDERFVAAGWAETVAQKAQRKIHSWKQLKLKTVNESRAPSGPAAPKTKAQEEEQTRRGCFTVQEKKIGSVGLWKFGLKQGEKCIVHYVTFSLFECFAHFFPNLSPVLSLDCEQDIDQLRCLLFSCKCLWLLSLLSAEHLLCSLWTVSGTFWAKLADNLKISFSFPPNVFVKTLDFLLGFHQPNCMYPERCLEKRTK